MNEKDIEDGIEKVNEVAYKWVCPKDRKQIGPCLTKARLRSLIDQHIQSKHRGIE